MLIMDQTKQIIVNLDNVNYIWVERKTNSIKALLNLQPEAPGEHFPKITLGTYNSLEDCQKVLKQIFLDYGYQERTFRMPLGGEVEKRS